MKDILTIMTVFLPSEVFHTKPLLLQISYEPSNVRQSFVNRQSPNFLSLANLVDVAGEVEHLVGEAPLIGIAFGASLKTTDLQSLLYSGFYAKSLLHL